MERLSPGARIVQWRSRIKNTWLISVNGVEVSTVTDLQPVLADLVARGLKSCTLLFSHPEIRHGLTNKGIPQVNLDQVNPCCMFDGYNLPSDRVLGLQAEHLLDGGVFNLVTMR